MKFDLVYPLVPSESGDIEIRYSLRSAQQHVDIGRVWTVGYSPGFLQCNHIPFQDEQTQGLSWKKIINVFQKLRKVCEDMRVSDPFVLMNDDFILLEPFAPVHWVTGSIQEAARIRSTIYPDSYYSKSMDKTARLVPSSANYETHTPMLIYKNRFLQVNPDDVCCQNPALFRTLYGAIEDRILPVEIPWDVKYYQNMNRQQFEGWVAEKPFFSTPPDVGQVASLLDVLYPNPSRWECEVSKKI